MRRALGLPCRDVGLGPASARDRLRRRRGARPRPRGARRRHRRDPHQLGRGAGAPRPPRRPRPATSPACRWRRARSPTPAARSPGSRSIPAATIGDDFFIDHGAGVVIGETAEIGDRVTLFQGVTLGGTGFARGKRHPTVEDDVTIGSGAKLLGPVTVGHGAKVGANTVVIEDVPPRSTVVGNPGHPVRVEGRKVEGPDADWIHLPDPVADAIKGLSERIGELESAWPSSTASPPRARSASCAASRAPRRPAAEPAALSRRHRGYPRPCGHRDGLRSTADARREPGRAPAGGAEPAPARGGRARRGAAAGARRRRLREDPGAHPPDRLPGRHRARRGPARSSRSPSPTRPPPRCASASSSWSAASRG